MKIYEIGTGYTPIPAKIGAATEIVVEELTRALIQNNKDAEIVDIQAASREDIDLPITEVKVPSVFTKNDVSLGIAHKLKRVVYSCALAFKLKRILKNASERVVLHFHNQYNLFFFLKLTSKKVRQKAIIAYTVHSYIWGDEWEKIENTVKKRYFQEVHCVKNADAVFVLNSITREHFVSKLGVDGERIFKIVNGVNADRYAPMPEEAVLELKKKHGLDGKKIIFQVGSVCERKNQLDTVKMLAEYLKDNPGVIYMYAGGIIDDDYKKSIDEYSKENCISEQVVYAGELSPGEQLNEYYNMASCCVFTSKLESFGLVIIEAISAGVPVIVGKELMFDLNSGYRVYNSEDDFVALVNGALKDDSIAWFDSKETREKYSWNAVSDVYTDVFRLQHEK